MFDPTLTIPSSTPRPATSSTSERSVSWPSARTSESASSSSSLRWVWKALSRRAPCARPELAAVHVRSWTATSSARSPRPRPRCRAPASGRASGGRRRRPPPRPNAARFGRRPSPCFRRRRRRPGARAAAALRPPCCGAAPPRRASWRPSRPGMGARLPTCAPTARKALERALLHRLGDVRHLV